MKIGTKANAIDDLGKFDGSKMTIKVNGKQIYPQKRYAIVEVDGGNCQLKNDLSEFYRTGKFCNFGVGDFGDCKDNCDRYGDTKEQLVRKVAQVMFVRRMRIFKKVWGVECKELDRKMYYEQCLCVAKEIIDFLGVEE